MALSKPQGLPKLSCYHKIGEGYNLASKAGYSVRKIGIKLNAKGYKNKRKIMKLVQVDIH